MDCTVGHTVWLKSNGVSSCNMTKLKKIIWCRVAIQCKDIKHLQYKKNYTILQIERGKKKAIIVCILNHDSLF